MRTELFVVVKPAGGTGRHPSDGEICEALSAEEPEEYVIDHIVECDLCQKRLQNLQEQAGEASL